MQLQNEGQRRVVRVREARPEKATRSLSVYSLPLWFLRSMEVLLQTLPGVTNIRVILLAGQEELGRLSFNLKDANGEGAEVDGANFQNMSSGKLRDLRAFASDCGDNFLR